MTTEMTTAALIEIVDSLATINKNILKLTEDVLTDVSRETDSTTEEGLNIEIKQWAELYGRVSKTLQYERIHIKELQERVWELEAMMFTASLKW